MEPCITVLTKVFFKCNLLCHCPKFKVLYNKKMNIRGVNLESVAACEKVITEIKEPIHSNNLKLTFEML